MIPPILKIQEVVRINRDNSKIKTVNKSCFVLSCRLQGRSLFLYQGKTLPVARGDVLYIPRGCSYTQEGTDEEIVYIHFDAYSPLAADIRILSTPDPDRVCSLFVRCAEEYTKKEKNYRYRCLSILYEILSLGDLTRPDAAPENPLTETLRFYIDANITSPQFSISALCRHCGISRAYCEQLFKAQFHQTPIQYVNCRQIEKAKLLLLSEHYSNEEIASLCGFGDVKYFYVVFKKITGMTTRQFKTQTCQTSDIQQVQILPRSTEQ